jgi:hypothetical protein
VDASPNRVRRVLAAHGFEVEQELPVQTDFGKYGQTISIVLLARVPDGRIMVPGIPEWDWRVGALPPRKRTLAGLTWRTMSPAQLLDEKERYEAGTGRPPRPKDLVSMALLRRLVSPADSTRCIRWRGAEAGHDVGVDEDTVA